MILDKRTIFGLRIGIVASMLFGAQFVLFAEIMPVYAAPSGWDASGVIAPNTAIPVVKLLPHAKALSDHLNIPILRMQGQEPSKSSGSQVLATTTGTQTVTGTGNISGLGYDNVTPPDVQVAAGPTNVMEMVNLQGAVYAKSGSLQTGPFSLSTFFGTGSNSISDPKVLYDSISGRWFASLTDISTSSIRVAVSQSSDATGSFCVYNIAGSSRLLLDQPIIGISSDKFVVSVNDFSKYSGQFKQAQYWVLNKSQMLACSSSNFVTKGVTSYFSLHPVQSLTSISTEYMVTTLVSSSGSTVGVFAINGVPPNAVSVSTSSLQVSSILSPPSAVQQGTSYALDTGDYRVQDAVWANGTLWLAHNNGCTPAGDASSRSCIHLIQVNTTTMSVAQDFNYGQSGKYLYYPAIREIPSSGNLFVVFGLSSASDYPAIEVSEHASSDPANSLEAPTLVQAGQGPVTLTYGCSGGVCRYGDYFGAGLDPSVPNGVWVAGEYGSGVNTSYGPAWGTKIASFTG